MEEILKLHHSNLKDLYRTRGVPPDWAVTGRVDEWDIIDVPKNMEGSGLLVYTWLDGYLDIKLSGPEGIVHSSSKPYEKEALVQKR